MKSEGRAERSKLSQIRIDRRHVIIATTDRSTDYFWLCEDGWWHSNGVSVYGPVNGPVK